MATGLVTAQWQLTCFVATALPLPVLLRVWDCMLVEGSGATLLRFCAAVFKLHVRRTRLPSYSIHTQLTPRLYVRPAP